MEKEEFKREYEITYLVREENDEPVRSVLEKHKVVILEDRPLQKIRLEYPILKQVQAFLGVILFRAEGDKVALFGPDFRLDDKVLRFLVTEPVSVRKSDVLEKTRDYGSGNEGAGDVPSGNLGFAQGRGDRGFRDELTNEALEKKIEEILK